MAKKPKQRGDVLFLLKLLFYLVIGFQWLKINTHNHDFSIPYGALLGLAFAAHDHFAIDRKIEYAVLAIAMLVGYFAAAGLVLSFK